MPKRTSNGAVGVIVARFQVPTLHTGHRYLIDYVRKRHEDVLIVLGVHGGVRTKNNQLTFEERKLMLMQCVRRKLTIVPLNDHPFSHIAWSKNLDALIRATFPGREAVLYGSRGSFMDKYEGGDFPTRYISPVHEDSGTRVREAIEAPRSAAGRAGIIFATMQRPDFIYSTSDLAIRNPKTGQVLVTEKKKHDGLYAFMGGHAEKADGNGKAVVVRENGEEIKGIRISDPIYVATEVIDDPLYRGTNDGVMTTFYYANYLEGDPVPSDDIDAVHWINPDSFSRKLVPWHRKLGEKYLERFPA